MKVFAIETTTLTVSVAVVNNDEGLIAEAKVAIGIAHAEQLSARGRVIEEVGAESAWCLGLIMRLYLHSPLSQIRCLSHVMDRDKQRFY
jgi:hypothetical protein